MQKWAYVQIQACWSDEDYDRDFHVRYMTVEGVRIEKPEPIGLEQKTIFGGKMVTHRKLNNEESWSWLYSKISELGQDGWEMVSAPGSEINPSASGGSATTNWILWFKRPIA